MPRTDARNAFNKKTKECVNKKKKKGKKRTTCRKIAKKSRTRIQVIKCLLSSTVSRTRVRYFCVRFYSLLQTRAPAHYGWLNESTQYFSTPFSFAFFFFFSPPSPHHPKIVNLYRMLHRTIARTFADLRSTNQKTRRWLPIYSSCDTTHLTSSQDSGGEGGHGGEGEILKLIYCISVILGTLLE